MGRDVVEGCRPLAPEGSCAEVPAPSYRPLPPDDSGWRVELVSARGSPAPEAARERATSKMRGKSNIRVQRPVASPCAPVASSRANATRRLSRVAEEARARMGGGVCEAGGGRRQHLGQWRWWSSGGGGRGSG